MKILITGGCGFIGSNLSIFLKSKGYIVYSLDALVRKGSSLNLRRLKNNKIKNFKINITSYKKILNLPIFDLIIDCCAEASIEASRISNQEARRVFETNLVGTFNILQKCVKDKAKIIFLSSSRVYSIEHLRNIIPWHKYLNKIKCKKTISLNFNSEFPKSLYGFTKKASENLIEEFCFSNQVNYIINRFGVVAGPWQFGKVDQGFLSLWIWKHINNSNLKYIGFGGTGNQVRDLLHVNDLCELIFLQIQNISKIKNIKFNIGGGIKNSISLKELTRIVSKKTKNKIIFKKIKKTSIYDIPYYVACNKNLKKKYDWQPKKTINDIIDDTLSWQKNNFLILKRYFK